MEFTQEEFKEKFQEGQDQLLAVMAEDKEVSMSKFYSMACFLENLTFFTPFLYSLLKENKSDNPEVNEE
ncbi:hypothetical protein RCC89_12460 [Cytophagaceae bacterium ABcell3]|nr:hypothetical protein RCC89_12460 [Cytophagaceae bacterium ABcell3]